VHPSVIPFEKRKLEVETEVKKCTSLDYDRVLGDTAIIAEIFVPCLQFSGSVA